MSKNTCGGCRVFAEDGLGGGPGCPEPLLPPLTRLGKIGNREYLKNSDYRLLFGVWQEYGFEPEDDEDFEEETPPEPTQMDSLPTNCFIKPW